VEAWEDAFQQQVIPRYEKAVGRPLDFDIEEPNLDNAGSLIEKAGAMRGLIALGFDPKAAIGAVKLDHIKWTSLPDMLDPAKQAELARQAADAKPVDGLRVVASDTNRRDQTATQQTLVGKARAEIMGREFPGLRAAMASFLAEQRERLVARLEELLPASKAARKGLPDGWWNSTAEDAALLDHLRTFYVSIGRDALQLVADQRGSSLDRLRVDRLLADMLGRAGIRISDINETTRRSVADTLTEGLRRGYSIRQLTSGVPAETYGGVRGALLDNGVNAWDDYRAEVIARTETMNAYNQSALLGYREFRVREVQAIDGDTDADCANRNGRVYPVDDALSISDHPNGTLDWAPISN
jgi:hypothetical protein